MINILFLIWTAEDVEFFVPSINGAHDAAEDHGISMYMEFGDSDTAKTNDILETAIANEVDGIAMTVWDDDAFDEIVCKAMDANCSTLVKSSRWLNFILNFIKSAIKSKLPCIKIDGNNICK